MLHDTCGVHNLHGIPGVLGGIISAVVVGFYSRGVDKTYTAPFDSPAGSYPPSFFLAVTDFLGQSLLQLLGTLASFGFAIIFGVITGYIVSSFYEEKVENFYEDKVYFLLDEMHGEEKAKEEH